MVFGCHCYRTDLIAVAKVLKQCQKVDIFITVITVTDPEVSSLSDMPRLVNKKEGSHNKAWNDANTICTSNLNTLYLIERVTRPGWMPTKAKLVWIFRVQL